MIRATRKATSLDVWWQNAYPGGNCRNLLVERFLADKTKTHLVFLDTDMGVPERGLDLLLESNEPLVCGPAPICRLRNEAASPHAWSYELTTNVMDNSDPASRGRPATPEDTTIRYTRRAYEALPDQVFRCDATGMSFCLIAREILERMTPPWFYFVASSDRRTVGVDVYFFRKASQLGYRVAVHPEVWCDHIKETDLTHLEQLLGDRAPDPQWNWTPGDSPPRTMIVACTTRRWLDIQTAEYLLRWQEQLGDRAGLRMIYSNDVGAALARALREPALQDPGWERIMLLGPDIVPTNDLVQRLGSIDAPIVSTLSRGLVDGRLAYTFARRDPATGRIEYPTQLSLSEITEPFAAYTVDLSCSLIKPETCKHVPQAARYAVDQPDPARAFSECFVELVRQETGRDPVVAPVVVQRRADVGLLSLLRLKHKLQVEERARAAERPTVCV
ncbi:MAG: hypothetical protein ACE5I3_09420 [Phycisphaerae bacterium]